MKPIVVAAAAVVWLAAGAALAKPIPDAGLTVDEVKAWMEGEGYKVTPDKYDNGDRFLRSESGGVTFSVDFYDCKDDHCRAVQFSAGFDMDNGLPLDKVSQWNREKRYLRCFDDSEGDPHFAYDANLAPGGSYEALKDDLDVFTGFLPEALAFIGW